MIVSLPGHGDVDLNLATCSYRAFAPDMGVPVRTSVGKPWHFDHGPLAFVSELAPYGNYDGTPLRKIEDKALFREVYRARLNARGVAIVEKLVDLTRGREGIPLVCLCYEDVHEHGVWCHRQFAASWLHDQLGLDVPELSPAPAAPAQGSML